MEGPTSRGEEPLKKVPTTSSSSGERRGKEVSVNAVNTAHQASQQYSHQPQSIYYSALPISPPMTSQPYDHYAPASVQPPQPRPPVSRAPPPAQQNPAAQGPQAGGKQS
ncbi:hypothetical protein CRG98_033180 [Punica granatum]|uniref:Uncharacterized protein n=1 Tax=Punica granatum TaxID=22663 RepID=A0A2I0IR16_PUNGR|nr:hypothetical protein CRG98_033180 [Punica granatum]